MNQVDVNLAVHGLAGELDTLKRAAHESEGRALLEHETTLRWLFSQQIRDLLNYI